LFEVILLRILSLRQASLDVLGHHLTSGQELLANVDQLTQQRDAAKNELEMARDTAKTYYQKMVQAETDSSRMKISMVAFRTLFTLPSLC
jgi:hypothetical protein